MTRSIRFAVVGLGPFAQTAILPAIDRQRGATITALVSSTPENCDDLARRYGVTRVCEYAQYDDVLASGEVDAAYLALPTHLHADAVIRAANHGIHVLCEKPMAPTEAECRIMIEACRRHDVRLMLAYRLHYQAARLHVVDLIRRGEIGEPRLFSSVFSCAIGDDSTGVAGRPGAGPLFDLGASCINAARDVFQDEPFAVHAHRIQISADASSRSVEEGVAATLRFTGGRVASFACSHGAAERSHYDIVGTRGVIEVDQAYISTRAMTATLIKDGKRERRSFRRSDQVAAEVAHFVRCIRKKLEPQPSGHIGLADVNVIAAIYEAARTGVETVVASLEPDQPVTSALETTRPTHGMVGAPSASRT